MNTQLGIWDLCSCKTTCIPHWIKANSLGSLYYSIAFVNGAKRYAHSECIKFKIWHLKHTRRSTISYYSHLNITSLKFHCNTHLFKTNNFTISCTNLILRHSVWRKQRKPNKNKIFWAINNYKITIIGSKLFILLPPFLFPNKYGIKMFEHNIKRFEWKSQGKMVALHLYYRVLESIPTFLCIFQVL